MNIDEEGYILDVNDDGVQIKAKAQKGLNYAFCTLKQLLFNYKLVLPFCHIEDEPYLKYRGMLLDNGRYFYPVEDVLKLIVSEYLVSADMYILGIVSKKLHNFAQHVEYPFVSTREASVRIPISASSRTRAFIPKTKSDKL